MQKIKQSGPNTAAKRISLTQMKSPMYGASRQHTHEKVKTKHKWRKMSSTVSKTPKNCDFQHFARDFRSEMQETITNNDESATISVQVSAKLSQSHKISVLTSSSDESKMITGFSISKL